MGETQTFKERKGRFGYSTERRGSRTECACRRRTFWVLLGMQILQRKPGKQISMPLTVSFMPNFNLALLALSPDKGLPPDVMRRS